MQKPYFQRLSVIIEDLRSPIKTIVEEAVFNLYELIKENVTNGLPVDKDLFEHVFKVAKDNSPVRQKIVDQLQKLKDASPEIKRLIQRIERIPTLDSRINGITRIMFSISALLGGISVWLSWNEGLLAAITVLSITLSIYFVYSTIKWIREMKNEEETI